MEPSQSTGKLDWAYRERRGSEGLRQAGCEWACIRNMDDSLLEVTLGVRVIWIWATVWTGTLWGAGFWNERAAERLVPDQAVVLKGTMHSGPRSRAELHPVLSCSRG